MATIILKAPDTPRYREMAVADMERHLTVIDPGAPEGDRTVKTFWVRDERGMRPATDEELMEHVANVPMPQTTTATGLPKPGAPWVELDEAVMARARATLKALSELDAAIMGPVVAAAELGYKDMLDLRIADMAPGQSFDAMIDPKTGSRFYRVYDAPAADEPAQPVIVEAK